MRRKLNDLMVQRTACVADAEAALAAGNQADYESAMEKVRNLNTEIGRIQDLITEQGRQFAQHQPSAAEARDAAEERGAALIRGDAITLNFNEVRRGLVMNQTTLATGTLVEPTGAGSTIRDGHNGIVSSIVDQVRVVDLTGMGGFLEPYVIEDMAANAGGVKTLAGSARAATDPKFGVAEIKPYEVNVTSYIDRNIGRMSPANYFAKVQQMAMRALRRKVAGLIVNGDGTASPTMFGITTAKNKAGENIFATAALGAISENTLDLLYFAYGAAEGVGADGRLLLTKANLKAIGALRGANEKGRLFKITPDAGNANTGVITDGGVIIPYTLVGDVGDTKLLYGDPMNYELGLFGEYTIRVDESAKAVERMHTILGDVFVGGNLIADKGFVVGTVAAG